MKTQEIISSLPYAAENNLVQASRRLAQEFSKKELPHHIPQAEETPKRYPVEFMQKCAELGLLGMDIPEEYGGIGMSMSELCAVIEELSYGHAGLALNVLVHNSLAAYPIAAFGNEEQKNRYLPAMSEGQIIGCFGLTEPDTGSDAKAIKTQAMYDETRRGYILNGTKQFITGANGAGLMVIATRTGTTQQRGKGISTFIVDMGAHTSGVSVAKIETKVGQPGSQLCQVVFSDYFVPEENMLGAVNEGWPVIEATLQHSRIAIAAQASGISIRAQSEAESYADAREAFGKKLNQIGAVADILAIMDRQAQIGQLLVKKAAHHEDSNDPMAFFWGSVAKLITSENAPWLALNSMLVHGGMGYTMEMPIAGVYTDSPVLRIYEGAAPIQILILNKFMDKKLLNPLFPPTNLLTMTIDDLPSVEEVMNEVENWPILSSVK